MIRSHVVEIDGIFAGAAVPQHDGRIRFIAVDVRVDDLDGSVWPTLGDLRRVVRGLLKTGRLVRAEIPEIRAGHRPPP